MIYILQAGSTNLFKIGFTRGSIETRIASLQTGSPHKLHLIHYFDGNSLTERVLHSRFACRRVQGEWFQLSEDDLGLITDPKWVRDYVVMPCELHMAGVPKPCGCGDAGCLFCEPANYDEFIQSYL